MSERSPHATGVRRARVADVPILADVMARAFRDDPLMRWIVPDEAGRVRRLRRFFEHSVRRMIEVGFRQIYTTEDRTGEATWAAPGRCRVPSFAMLPAMPGIIGAVGVRGVRRSARAYAILHERHPRPHWYLEGLATDPHQQGRGVATALLAPVLDGCDRDGVAAYLETQNPENVPFYERRGFVVTGTVDLPRGGPRMWLMVRAPRR